VKAKRQPEKITQSPMAEPAPDTENAFRVPIKQWRKWSPKAREVFNYMYGLMTANPDIFFHTDQEPIRSEHWHVQCWNAAWIAAYAVDRDVSDDIPYTKALKKAPVANRRRVVAEKLARPNRLRRENDIKSLAKAQTV
jgi:hypothetical protein